MIPDERDTIAAIATAPAGAARGIVRLSGPDAVAVIGRMLGEDAENRPASFDSRPARYGGRTVPIALCDRTLSVACDVLVWPGTQSYTKQPSAELHTLGSAPVVEAVLEAACLAGARLAEPGEFTLRAFLAGRIDLTQAEAVLGVIDAGGDGELQAALGQLAGGLLKPLQVVREDLVQLLAELEAGLDFVDEEDIRFVEPDELQRRLSAANEAVASLIEQTAGRSLRQSLPRVVLTGPPNAGKSSLFNSLRQRCRSDTGDHPGALVSPQAGTTRDSVTALLEADGVRFELIDTAGREQTNSTAADQSADEPTPIETAADQQAYRDTQQADLRLVCHAATPLLTLPDSDTTQEIAVLTKADLATGNREPGNWLKTSSQTGEGLDALVTAIADRLRGDEASHAGFLAATAERCRQSLELAQQSLHAACEVAVHDQHELVAFELRTVLDTLGQVTGAVVTDDLLDRIFSQFCIGK